MGDNSIGRTVGVLFLVFAGCPKHSPPSPVDATIRATGPYNAPGRPGFDHGRQTTTYCGNNPESWIRGDAKLDRGATTISVLIELETDSVGAGPKGFVHVTIKDAEGQAIASVDTPEIGVPGKPPGNSVVKVFGSHAPIEPSVSKRAASMTIEATCTGSSGGLFGITKADIEDAFELIKKYAGPAL